MRERDAPGDPPPPDAAAEQPALPAPAVAGARGTGSTSRSVIVDQMSAGSAGSGDPLPRALALLALAGIAAWVLWDRWRFLSATPFPLGIDGYWYPVELRSLLSTGHLYYASEPLSLWLMAPLAALAGPVTGAKLGAALAAAALPVAVYPVARRISGQRAVALVAAALAASSAGSFYLATEFVKTEFGLPLALAFLAALAWTLEGEGRARRRWRSRRAGAAAALLLATALTHELALALALVGAAPVLAVHVGRRRAGRRRAWMLAAAAAPVLVLALLVAVNRGVTAHLFAGRADWSLPALRLGPRVLWFRHEPAWGGLLGVAALVLAAAGWRIAALRAPTSAVNRALAIGPSLWALAVALPWLDATRPDGLTFRLRAVAFVPLCLCAAAVLGAALARARPTLRMAIAMFITGLVLVRPAPYVAPVVAVDRDLAAAVAAAAGQVPPGDVLITPERHIVFMAVWYTGARTRLRPESVPPARRLRLVPMSYMTEDLLRAVDDARVAPGVARPRSLHRGNPDGLVLMTEATWTWVLGRLPPREAEAYRRWPTH